ncbi:hypothetical protein A2635_04180 [Candidatus Peribacteria bacterium RIFCSPHIGHO2_01_FULL_51_9]|nr:MAG: hypothetical protein A2635_04180 [Candidatus Peribacteria bacterium RIFCSPHIGHO2_01_FULL_51_9]
MQGQKRVVIIGGGFGGIRCALDLAKQAQANLRITLISDKPHLEYYGALYRIVAGHSPLSVCVPLHDIFEGKNVEVIRDTVTIVNGKGKEVCGESGSRYAYDYLVIAVGSEASFFNIPGVEKLSFTMRSINDALKLKRHLHEVFEETKIASKEDDVPLTHIVIIGGGATGVELAGELAVYARDIARKHNVEPHSLVTIDLIEALPRLLPGLGESVSERVQRRLYELGVNIYLNRTVVKEEVEELHMKDMSMKTKTVIWTAGIRGNRLLSGVEGILLDKKGRALVDEFLRARTSDDIFVIGDAASTEYSGMAQTAVQDGHLVAQIIGHLTTGKPLSSSKIAKPAYAIPIGPQWAIVVLGPLTLYGRLGWWLRRAADLKVFLSILPWRKAWRIFCADRTITEACDVCAKNEIE